MRLSTGGFYEIDGSALRAVPGTSAGPVAANGWRDRQADLWAESSALMHVNRRLTVDEIGLCSAMQREVDRIRRALNGLEDVARAASTS